MKLSSGDASLYRYFPFIFQISADAPQAEVGEIRQAFDDVEVTLERIRPVGYRVVVIDFESELSCVPVQAGIGTDQRDLALLIKSVMVRERPASAQGTESWQRKNAKLALDRPDSSAPVFVIGPGRSGSSVLTWAIGQHPNIAYIDETNWLPLMLYGAASGFQMASRASMSAARRLDISEDLLLQYIGQAVDRLHRHVLRGHATRVMLTRLANPTVVYEQEFQAARSNWCPKRRWVDGAPVNTMATRIIARAFPESQFILTVRDPLQVIASFQRFTAKGGPDYSVRDTAIWWLRATEAGMKALAEFGDGRVLLLFYEKFLENPIALMRACFRFLNEPNFDASARTFMTIINATAPQGEVEEASYSNWIEDPVVKHCVEVYEQLRNQVPSDEISWGAFATGDLAAWERDLRTRLIGCFAGTPDTD
ncbi:sulfotransferase family protein [Methyloceanibacter sp.]|uniref:sulfotransferase family protein n=1 Tax=Methyloceanibacter sp. TaxID=1965321 RepID=UPI003D6CB7B1